MNVRTQIVVAAVLLAALAIVVNMVRKRRLELRYALAWLGLGIGILILDCFPELMGWTADQVGIASPTNMLFFCGFLFALIIIFTLTVSISRTSVKIKELAQEVAFLEKKLREMSGAKTDASADSSEKKEF